MKQFNEHITHISADKMQAYLDESLSSRERHLVEKHLLDCDLCAEAMEGLELIPAIELTHVNDSLKEKLKKRTSAKSDLIQWSIAASISLLLVFSIYLVFNIVDNENALSPVVFEKNIQTEPETNEYLVEDSIKINSGLMLSDNSNNNNADEIEVAEQVSKVQQIPKPKTVTKALPKSVSEKVDIIEENFIALNDDEVAVAESLMEDVEFSDDFAQTDVFDNQEQIDVLDEEENLEKLVSKKKSVARSTFSSNEANLNKIGQEKFLNETQYVISGFVTAQEDGLPIPGVNVIIKNSTNGTITNMAGKYSLELLDDSKELIFSFIGMQTLTININGRDSINVAMSTDQTELSEVVVTAVGIEREKRALGYSVSKIEKLNRKPKPSIGFDSYEKYLKDSLIYPQEALDMKVEGKVKLDFDISETGEIQNIQIKKGLGHGCDEEAIRLLKEGTSWDYGLKNGEPVSMKSQLTVIFKM